MGSNPGLAWLQNSCFLSSATLLSQLFDTDCSNILKLLIQITETFQPVANRVHNPEPKDAITLRRVGTISALLLTYPQFCASYIAGTYHIYLLTGISWRNSVTQRPFHSSLEFINLISLSPDLALSGTSGKEPACQCRRLKTHRFDPWVEKIPWKKAWQPTPIFLPEESLGLRVRHDWSDLACTFTSICSYNLTGFSASTLWA